MTDRSDVMAELPRRKTVRICSKCGIEQPSRWPNEGPFTRHLRSCLGTWEDVEYVHPAEVERLREQNEKLRNYARWKVGPGRSLPAELEDASDITALPSNQEAS